ncbi:PspC domain-containing protein [Streptomyces sp. NPDC048664]|uniref:PspC domain-containing protein n=1 Tax=Streptomyces sp. NPDC048664 TaxID=3154505 RepID=UPI003428D434
MTDEQHAAAGDDPGAGHASAAGHGSAAEEEPRAQEDRGVRQDAAVWSDQTGSGDDTGNEGADSRADAGPASGASARPGAGPRVDSGSGAGPGRRAASVGGAGSLSGSEAAEEHGLFRRDRRHKVLGGVCSGLGRACDMDPVIFRIVLVVLSATGGLGLIFYGFAWLLIPYEGEEENEIRKLLTGRVDGQALAAVLFALVGCGVFLSMLRNGGVLTFAAVLSLLLAGAGYWSRQRGTPAPDALAAQAVADAPPEATAPPVPDSYPSWWRDPIVKDGTHVGGTGYLWGPSDTPGRDAAEVAAGGSLGRPYGRRPRSEAPSRPKGPRWTGGWIFLLALLAGALGSGLTWHERPLGTSLQTGLASALLVLGLGMAISSFLGRTGAGSVFLAIVTAGLLAGASALPDTVGTHWSRTTWAPATAAAVQERYELGAGVGTLDLGRLRPAGGQIVTTRAEVGVGRLEVVVPEGVRVELTADAGIGDIALPGRSGKDVDVRPDRHEQVTLSPVPGTRHPATLRLALEVGVGQVEVIRAAS